MKRYISLKEKYLLEKTFNINKDIDFIYNISLKDFVKNFKKGIIKPSIREKILNKKDLTFYSIESKLLPSKISKTASLVNPVKIKCGVYNKMSSHYHPINKEIIININPMTLRIYIESNFDIESTELPINQKKG